VSQESGRKSVNEKRGESELVRVNERVQDIEVKVHQTLMTGMRTSHRKQVNGRLPLTTVINTIVHLLADTIASMVIVHNVEGILDLVVGTTLGTLRTPWIISNQSPIMIIL